MAFRKKGKEGRSAKAETHEPAEQPAERPTDQPAERPGTGAAAEPAAVPAAKPAADPAAKPAADPAAKPAADPGAGPETRPASSADTPASPEAVRRSRSRSRGRGAARAAAGAGVVLAAGALIAAGTLVGPGQAGRSVGVPQVEVPAAELSAVCPDPPRLLSGDVAGTDPQFSPASESARTRVRSLVLAQAGSAAPAAGLDRLDGTVVRALAGSEEPPLTNQRGAAVLPAQDVGAATALRVDPTEVRQALANALLTFTAGDGDLTGLAAANCQAPSNDVWLAGARTTVGVSTVLQITNASATAASVDLDVFTGDGRVEAAGTRGIAVAPGQTRSVVLAGIAAGKEAVAVHVRSAGGPVAAVLQQNILRGLAPGGIELIQPAAAPATRQVIPGVRQQDPRASARLAGERFTPGTTAVQLTVPGSTPAEVAIRAIGTDGRQLELAAGTEVAAGASVLVPVDLPQGEWTLEITADVAVLGAAVYSRGGDPEKPADFAVAPAAARLSGEQLALMPTDGSTTLLMTAPAGAAEVRLVALGSDGAALGERVVELSGGSTVALAPNDVAGTTPAALLVSSSGEEAYAAQIVSGGEAGISAVPVPRGGIGARSVEVGLGY